MRRVLTALACAVVFGYVAVCALLFAAQRKLIYFPEPTRVAAAATDYRLERDGAVLRGWVVNPGRASAIVYFGGNGESVQANAADFAAWFPQRTVYLLAYRGYGASDGTPSADALLGDALAFFDDVQVRHPEQPVSAVGRSLGSGVASHVASRRPVDRLALVTPFDSLADVAQAHYRWLPVRWLLRDAYPSTDWLRDRRGPVLVLRAGRDEVVPAANTDALVAALGRPQIVAIDAAGHNDIQDFPAYGEALAAFLR